jgi:hypothetical protein
MSIVTTSPTLSYVSSQDVSIAPSGTTNYTILFDASNVTSGNVIMFEYKIQTKGSPIPSLNNTSFGFVAVENAIQAGIANQYMISVPADSQTEDGVPVDTIQVRVYYGSNSSSDVVVSDWSNELDVHLPPVTPVIFTPTNFDGAFYDPSQNLLFVVLEASANTYDYDNIEFIVCFFYQDITGTTVWKVSDPTSAQPTLFGPSPFWLIEVPLEGVVSTDPAYKKVYVSIHAVYDWVNDASLNFHSVSYMSNEVIAVESSEDNTPDITDVSYNVYNTNPLAVPGDQTMTVSWIPPGNSLIPFFAVDHYELYYALDGSSGYTLYADDISSNILEYTVNVGANSPYLPPGLNLQCGQSIVFRVDAVDVNGDDNSSLPSASTNIFKYSEAVTDLEITNATWDQSLNLVGFTVNFQGVSSDPSANPNKGCGIGLQYVVEINGIVETTSSSLNYVSDLSYSIVYSGLSISQVGDVKVYLQTQNTNAYPSTAMDGLSSTVPYIANIVELDPVDYQVYANDGNNEDQKMVLTWSDPTLSDWSIVQHDVQYSTNGGTNWTTAATLPGTTFDYTFDASDIAVSVTNISFRVLATMENVNGSTQYVIESNIESQFTFKYAEDVVEPTINWVIGNTSFTTMDVYVTFKNPLIIGVNNGLSYFTVTVTDASFLDVSSQNIPYNPSASLYDVYFNDISYNATGSVRFQPFVVDTNGRGLITSVNYEQDPGYVTSRVPFFRNIVVDVSGDEVTGEILTFDPLKTTGVTISPSLDPSSGFLATPKSYGIPSSGTATITPGLTITRTRLLPSQEYKYLFTMTLSVYFGGNVPPGFVMNAANNAGIGAERIVL